MPEWTYPKHEEKPKFAQLVIPTLDSVRCVAAAACWEQLHSAPITTSAYVAEHIQARYLA